MRTTCQLVQWEILLFIEPIRAGIRKNGLTCKLVMHRNQRFIMTGLTNENVLIFTNQILCYKASSTQGVSIRRGREISTGITDFIWEYITK